MEFLRNFPCFSVILTMCASIVSSGMNGKWARKLNIVVISTVGLLSAAALYLTIVTNQCYVYKMGRFPAPWGNEIRFGVLETLMALFCFPFWEAENIFLKSWILLRKIFIMCWSTF